MLLGSESCHRPLQASTRKLLGPALSEGLPLPAVAHLVPGLLQALSGDPAKGISATAYVSPESPLAAEGTTSTPSFLSCLPSSPRNPSRGMHSRFGSPMHIGLLLRRLVICRSSSCLAQATQPSSACQAPQWHPAPGGAPST